MSYSLVINSIISNTVQIPVNQNPAGLSSLKLIIGGLTINGTLSGNVASFVLPAGNEGFYRVEAAKNGGTVRVQEGYFDVKEHVLTPAVLVDGVLPVPNLPSGQSVIDASIAVDNIIENATFVPKSDASQLTGGILPAARIADGSIADVKLVSGTKLSGIATGATANRADSATDSAIGTAVSTQAATDAATYARLADLRALGIFTPDNYGAGALGTDSSAAVQAAFNAARTSVIAGTGGTVMLLRPYDCQGIVWPRDVRLTGMPGALPQSTAGVDPNIPVIGSTLRLFSGANQDLLRTEYFNHFTTGTTLSAGISSGATTIPVVSTAGYPTAPMAGTAPMTLTIGGENVTYTGISGNTFTGCSGVTATRASGLAVVLAQTVYQVPGTYQMDNIALLGNKANNSSGRCFAGLAKSFRFQNFRVFSSPADGIYLAQSVGSSNLPSMFSDFEIGYSVGHNLNLAGTTDSQFVNGLVSNAGGSNILEGAVNGNLNFTNIHAWGGALYNFDMQCNSASHVNCVSDGTGSLTGVGIRLNAQNVSWDGGNIYGIANTKGQTLLQLGNNDGAAHTVTGCRFRTLWTNFIATSVLILYADAANLSTYHNEFGGNYTVGTNNKFLAYGNRLVTSGSQAVGTTQTLVMAAPITNMPATGSLYLPNGSGGGINVLYSSFSGSTFIITAPTLTVPDGTVVWNTTQYGLPFYGQEDWLFAGHDGNGPGLNIQKGDYTGHPSQVDLHPTTFASAIQTNAGFKIASGYLQVIAVAKTANYTLAVTDSFVTFNGTSLTATLPSASSGTNVVFIIKNLNASTLTISGTVDGTASPTLAQNKCMIITSNGSVWMQIGGF